MIDILSTSQVLLREALFTTRLQSVERSTVLCFEDDALVGFCSIFESPRELLDGWQARELSILKEAIAHRW